jgi:hypothetical protein
MMTEIEKVKAEIKVLEKKLALLEEMEKHKSPIEKAYRDTYGKYPEPGFSANDWDAATWDAFQKGYEAAQSKAVDDPDWYDEVEWDEKDNPKPMDEVMDRLENKYKKYGGTSYMTDEVIDRLMEKWKEEPPEFLKFELGKTLEQIVERWWVDVYDGMHKDWDTETAIADLIDQIEFWLPREQSAEGSQNIDTMLLVDGFNDCLNKIKSKLRNKND